MDREKIRQSYIEAAISIGANQGLDAVTMRSMSEYAKINTSYLYRIFDDVNQVKLEAFVCANKIFVGHILKHIQLYEEGVFSESKARLFFKSLWLAIKKDAEMYEYFLRYYYGYVFPRDYATEESKRDLQPLLEKIRSWFKDEANLIRILLHSIEDLVKYAVLIRNGQYADTEETEEEIYQYLFGSLAHHLKADLRCEGDQETAKKPALQS